VTYAKRLLINMATAFREKILPNFVEQFRREIHPGLKPIMRAQTFLRFHYFTFQLLCCDLNNSVPIILLVELWEHLGGSVIMRLIGS